MHLPVLRRDHRPYRAVFLPRQRAETPVRAADEVRGQPALGIPTASACPARASARTERLACVALATTGRSRLSAWIWAAVAIGLQSLFASSAQAAAQTLQPNLIRSIELSTPAPAGIDRGLGRFLGMPLTPQVRRATRQHLLAVLAEPQAEWDVDTSEGLDQHGRWHIRLTPPPRPAAPTLQRQARPAAYTTAFQRWVDSGSQALIDRSARQLWLMTPDGPRSFPVAVGRPGHATPLGRRTVQAVSANPTWYPTPAMHRDAARQGRRLPRRVPPGPGNPLGSHFIALGDAIGIHGTNAPASIGRAVSRGCVRMHPDDILIVAASLRPGDAVWIVASINDSMAPLANRAARQDRSAQSTSSRHFLPTLPAEAGA
ncbi:hypothetical protein DEH80_03885 [Abyssibacter profundi]|uniref:L,D-TPase catalytic domain-containing protein n=1 Tax=Abyssibacter profundi TaxID=2182787 RepID=A0A363UNS7_9GAMM|nr:hypothetical protein DEH80_03885 [Abyssibacter profundi]